MTLIEDMKAHEKKALEDGKKMMEQIEEIVSIYGISELKGWKGIEHGIRMVFTTGGVIGLGFYGDSMYGLFISYVLGLADAGYFTEEKLKEIEERIDKIRVEEDGYFTKEKLKEVRENLEKMKEEALDGN